MAKFLILGSGELGKEFSIAALRLGQTVIAADSYTNAPAMHVAQHAEVIDLLDGEALETVVQKYQPDFIVPEIEAIRTEKLYEFEKRGITVIPSARAANFTMNRKAIRDLAFRELNIKTAKYKYATSLTELQKAVPQVGYPCIVKPMMSSSGKGQSTIESEADIDHAWEYALAGSRGDVIEVIVEEFIEFYAEITLLTVTQKNGSTLFCPPIGHRQEAGDYRESWQPAQVKKEDLKTAQEMSAKVTEALGGPGIWGVEFFIGNNGVYFSELSPRPHDTGMVTLANTQNFNEFELHLRAILNLPLPEITLERNGASAVILAKGHSDHPVISGLEKISAEPNSDFRIFGKPSARPNRRMGVTLTYDKLGTPIEKTVERAQKLAAQLKVEL